MNGPGVRAGQAAYVLFLLYISYIRDEPLQLSIENLGRGGHFSMYILDSHKKA